MCNIHYMLRKQTGKVSRKRGPNKYRGIVRDATDLGVSRIHLWFVLTGQRRSAGLLARYWDLQKTKIKKAA